MVVENAEKNGDGQFLQFRTLTYVPIDRDAIDTAYMQPVDNPFKCAEEILKKNTSKKLRKNSADVAFSRCVDVLFRIVRQKFFYYNVFFHT